MLAPAAAPERSGARPRAVLDGTAWATLALTLAYLALTVAGAFQVGTSWDEADHRHYGELALDAYTSLGADHAAATDRMRFYGALHAVAGALAERLLPFLHWPHARHLVTVAFGLLGFVYGVRLARHLAGPRAGLVAALLLATTPRWVGDAMYNPIDVAVAGLFAVALFHLARIASALPRAHLRDWIAFGAAAGATLAVRMAGLLLFFYAALLLGAWALSARDAARAEGPRLLVRLALAAGLALCVTVAFWPRLWLEPAAALLDSFARTKSYPWKGTVFFRGEHLSALELPRSYLPVWLWITTPLATMLGLALAAVLARWRARARLLCTGLVVFAALFPLAFAVLYGATLYDGIRHFLFVLPPLSALAATGWDAAIRAVAARGRALRVALPLALGACVLEPLVWYARAHPYEYAYFNPLAGGLARASHAYDAEYYGLSLRAAAEWLGELRASALGSARPLVVGTNVPWHLVEPWLDDAAQYRHVATETATDVRAGSFDVLLVIPRFLTFRLKEPLQPIRTLSVVAGQVPFWSAYAGPGLAGAPGGTFAQPAK